MPDNSLIADVLLDGHCAVSIDDSDTLATEFIVY